MTIDDGMGVLTWAAALAEIGTNTVRVSQLSGLDRPYC